MKFSEKRKRKIRKQNQRRINKCCKDIIGCCIDFECDAVVVDQARINDTMYLLTTDQDYQYAIYKIVKVGEYVKLSSKRILEKQVEFLNKAYWKEKCQLKIEADGTISLENTIFVY